MSADGSGSVRAARPAVLPVAERPSILLAHHRGPCLDHLISPVILYLLLALGGVGVCVALPRRGLNPQPIGFILAGIALGLVLLILGLRSRPYTPNLYFYIFAAIAL